MRKSRKYGRTPERSVERLREAVEGLPYIRLALFFGSRGRGEDHIRSDYDLVLLLEHRDDAGWGMQAKAWIDLCEILDLREYDLDVVDLVRNDGAMRSSIRQGYIPLKGDEDEFRRLFGQEPAGGAGGEGDPGSSAGA